MIIDVENGKKIMKVYELIIIYNIRGKAHFTHDSIWYNYKDAEEYAKKRIDGTKGRMDYQIIENTVQGYQEE